MKLIGEKMVTFRVGLIARWDATSGEVTQIPRELLPTDGGVGADDDDDAMSE